MAIILYKYTTPEEEARAKAEKEQLKRLKITNPEQYRKETSVRRNFLIFIGVLCAIMAILIVVLIATSK